MKGSYSITLDTEVVGMADMLAERENKTRSRIVEEALRHVLSIPGKGL